MAFHLGNGWYFERVNTIEENLKAETYGAVCIYHMQSSVSLDGELEEEPDVFLEIDPASWISIIASMSVEGETGYTFSLAKAFHNAGVVYERS